MATSEILTGTQRPLTWWALLAASALLFAAGLAGILGTATGYGLFLLATLLLLFGLLPLALYFMTRAFDGETLKQAFLAAFIAGGWCYVLAVAALGGHYAREALAGRMELQWILFGPAVIAAIVALDLGIYRVIVERNRATLERYRHVMARENLEPEAMRRTFLDEVVLHRTLLNVSPFRWLRHQLILWGFGLMFAVELMAVVFREAWPAFGFGDPWSDTGHPLRAAFDFAFDLTGLMVLLGCLLALVFRLTVNGKPEQKYTDTPTAVFLLAVVTTGFVLEGLRLGLAPEGSAPAQFVGYAFASALASTGAVSQGGLLAMWYAHVFLSCAFIAYVPARRLVHSCATPLGRLANSQKAMLALKKEGSLKGLLRGGAFATPPAAGKPDKPV
jgi:nitrate reductase gamma subunit